MSHLRPAFVLLIALTFITGVIYPLAITGLAQALLPVQANGSAVARDGRIVGSSLIGQNFVSERYFHGRPSATTAADPADASGTIDAPYNAANSSGSNLGPSSKALMDAVESRAAALGGGRQPGDLLTASGSGLDPHVSQAGALAQITRVARTRGVAEDRIRALVMAQTEAPAFGLLGEPRVNVLSLNLALDALRP